MIKEQVTSVSNLTDSEFLKYAKWFRRGDMQLQEYVTLRDSVIKRCNNLGYGWVAGCCGVNKLIPINKKGI